VLFLFHEALILNQSYVLKEMASSAVHPPGGTWFDSVKRSFVDVPIDENNNNAISTSEFLEASESLATLFGM